MAVYRSLPLSSMGTQQVEFVGRALIEESKDQHVAVRSLDLECERDWQGELTMLECEEVVQKLALWAS